MMLIAVIAACAQLLAPYLVWRSRWNIPTHLAAGFCVTAYIIPGLLTDVWDSFPGYAVDAFVQVNVVGAVALCVGIMLGGRGTARPETIDGISSGVSPTLAPLIRRVFFIITPCVAGLYLGYLIMGFIPMFAADPLSAKQFKGVYRDDYMRAAYLFRFCFSVLSASLPLLLIIAWYRRSASFMLLALSAFTGILISLARGATATGLLFFLGLLAARRRGGMLWYIPLVLVIFPFGSIFYYVLANIIGVEALRTVNVGDTFSEFISAGSPDIADQLGWFEGFLVRDYFTWGRTIYGGLIPGNYAWNPSVWTLTYNDIGASVADIVSGGLRLTTAEWGYANFGWFGVVALPFLSGFVNGKMLKYLKALIPKLTVIQAASALLVYATLGQQIVQFYFLSIHNLPAIAAALYFWNVNRSGQGRVGGTGAAIPGRARIGAPGHRPTTAPRG